MRNQMATLTYKEFKCSNNIVVPYEEKYGRYTVVKVFQEYYEDKKRRFTLAECRCECGKVKTVPLTGLKNGKIVSCGCFRSENNSRIQKELHTTHGLSSTYLYNVWRNMLKRVAYDTNYSHVSICNEWKQTPEKFIQWAMDNGGGVKGLDIDRVNNLGDYEPSNCRFVSRGLNLRNRGSLDKKYPYRGVRPAKKIKKGGFHVRFKLPSGRDIGFTCPGFNSAITKLNYLYYRHFPYNPELLQGVKTWA